MKKVLVTGAAGFIGFHTCRALLARGVSVLGIDNLNDYYSVDLKKDRLKVISREPQFQFVKLDFSNGDELRKLFTAHQPKTVIHLGAQAGVRYSIEHPEPYIQSNLVGFANILECCRHNEVEHLVYASSSSVYGLNTKMPFSTADMVNHPISLYAATKKSNELLAHTYSHLYRLPTTGLRFFTVYGPWGRPDMAPMLFAKAILSGEPIKVFNHGKMQRDFTYVDDIVSGVIAAANHPAKPNPSWDAHNPDPSSSSAPFRIFNIGNHQPVELMRFITLLEHELGRVAEKILLPMQDGDVISTYADIGDLSQAVGFSPSTPIEQGVHRFIEWYRDYYR